jgi:hypothetical protein
MILRIKSDDVFWYVSSNNVVDAYKRFSTAEVGTSTFLLNRRE